MAETNGTNGEKTGEQSGPPKRRGYTWDTEVWLKAYEDTRGVDQACGRVGIAVSTAYRRRDLDSEFKAAWLGVKAVHREQWRRSVTTRAIEGTVKPIYKEIPVRVDPNDPTSKKLRDADGDIVMKWTPVGAERTYETRNNHHAQLHTRSQHIQIACDRPQPDTRLSRDKRRS